MSTNTTPARKGLELSSFALHLLAMALMLGDHLWATLVPGQNWLTWLGRLAFPIFAFFIAEGAARTRDLKAYRRRVLLFALIAELPYNLMYSASWIYPFQQNVLWTFYLALLCLSLIRRVRAKAGERWWLTVPAAGLIGGFFALLGLLLMVDYGMGGVLTVLLFALFRGEKWYCRLGQLAGMIYIHAFLFSGLTVPVTLFGLSFSLPQQAMAVLALLPLWLYRGRQGPHSPAIRWLFYGFYPAHMLVLGLLSM